MSNMASFSAIVPIISSLPIIYISFQIWNYFNSPLKKIPGPFFAKFTNLWRLLDVYAGRAELTHCFLHNKYGSAVRIGPNVVSLSEPNLISTIYGSRSEYLKSDFYRVNDSKVGRATIKTVFGEQNNEIHTQMLRPIQKFYKLAHILELEGRCNIALEEFIQRIDHSFAGTGATCRMEDWLLYLSWDVIGYMTFSKTMGLVAAGSDYTGFLKDSEKANDYFGVIGQIPILDHWLGKNPVIDLGLVTFDHAAKFCAEQAISRQQNDIDRPSDQRDMLDDFLEIKKSNPEVMNDNAVIRSLLLNVLAGADTTAVTLRAVVYYTIKNQKVYRKLQREIDSLNVATTGTISYHDAAKLPYLDAVIKETNRIHPGVGLPLERVVPATGLALPDGTILPAGTIVGISAWVAHKNKRIFGEDAAVFRAERWLRYEEDGETIEQYQARLSAMKRADLTFGTGKRVCLGKNVSIVALYKVIATLFSKYEMSFVDPNKEWVIQNSWFVRQTGMDMKIEKRVPMNGL